MTSDPADLERLYDLRFATTIAYRNAVWKILCSDFFSTYVTSQATVLDLGAGFGEFCNNIAALKKYAMDLNPHCKDCLAKETVFFHQDCSEPWPLDDGTLDVVFTSNFLEHLPSKAAVQCAIAEAYRCLKPGGQIICLGPNLKYLPGRYWDFFDHQVPLTELSLSELLRFVGFQVNTLIPRFLPYTMSEGWHPALFMVRLYLKLPFVWRYFGKQFLLIGKKVREAPRRGSPAVER